MFNSCPVCLDQYVKPSNKNLLLMLKKYWVKTGTVINILVMNKFLMVLHQLQTEDFLFMLSVEMIYPNNIKIYVAMAPVWVCGKCRNAIETAFAIICKQIYNLFAWVLEKGVLQ